MSKLKVGDTVRPHDGSYAKLIDRYGISDGSSRGIVNNEDWVIVLMDSTLPTSSGSEPNDILMKSIKDGRLVAICSNQLNLVPTCKHCGGAL